MPYKGLTNNEDVSIGNHSITVVYAHSPIRMEGHAPAYHDRHRGSVVVDLFHHRPYTTSFPRIAMDAKESEIVMSPHFVVENTNREYYTLDFKYTFPVPMHLVGYEVTVDHADALHHVQVYVINSALRFNLILSWNRGVQPIRFEEMGVFFPAGNITLKYEFHYIPPPNRIVDNSSIRIVFSPDLRRHNVSFFFLGANPTRTNAPLIPTNTDYAILTVRIPSSCLFQQQPEDIQEMHIHRHQFHMHGSAIAAAMSHERDGQVLPLLGYNPHFDWSSYEQTPPTSRLSIKRGDFVTLYCVYNPSEVSKSFRYWRVDC
jgi:hypothetical protein